MKIVVDCHNLGHPNVYDLSANEKMINYHKNWGVMWRALKGSWLYGIKLNPLQLGFNDITLRDTMTTI